MKLDQYIVVCLAKIKYDHEIDGLQLNKYILTITWFNLKLCSSEFRYLTTMKEIRLNHSPCLFVVSSSASSSSNVPGLVSAGLG